MCCLSVLFGRFVINYTGFGSISLTTTNSSFDNDFPPQPVNKTAPKDNRLKIDFFINIYHLNNLKTKNSQIFRFLKIMLFNFLNK